MRFKLAVDSSFISYNLEISLDNYIWIQVKINIFHSLKLKTSVKVSNFWIFIYDSGYSNFCIDFG